MKESILRVVFNSGRPYGLPFHFKRVCENGLSEDSKYAVKTNDYTDFLKI